MTEWRQILRKCVFLFVLFFLTTHCFAVRKLSEERPHVLLNQFPCETILTTKDCLASVARRAMQGGHAPLWLPMTFNLQTELPQFIKHYLQRQERSAVWLYLILTHQDQTSSFKCVRSVFVLCWFLRGEDNHWICKPWNLARGLDTHITNNLDYIIRQRESTPKVRMFAVFKSK